MNLFWDMERPIFLPRSIIFERLGHFRTSLKKSVFLNLVKPVRYANIFLVCLSIQFQLLMFTLNNNLMVWYVYSLLKDIFKWDGCLIAGVTVDLYCRLVVQQHLCEPIYLSTSKYVRIFYVETNQLGIWYLLTMILYMLSSFLFYCIICSC